jgi:hypothetical protein
MIGFIDPSLYNLSLNYSQHSAIADLHTFQFTAAHALGFCLHCSLLGSGSQQRNYYFKSL